MPDPIADHFQDIARRIAEIARTEHPVDPDCSMCHGSGDYVVMGISVLCPKCRPVGAGK